MLISFVENEGNFQNDARDSIVLSRIFMSHYCYISIKGFLRPSTNTWHNWLSFLVATYFSIEQYKKKRHE